MRVEGGRLQLRIARPEAPPPGSVHKWERELATFQRHLGLDGWTRAAVPDIPGIAVIFTDPDSRTCACGRLVEMSLKPFGDPDTCVACDVAAKKGEATP